MRAPWHRRSVSQCFSYFMVAISGGQQISFASTGLDICGEGTQVNLFGKGKRALSSPTPTLTASLCHWCLESISNSLVAEIMVWGPFKPLVVPCPPENALEDCSEPWFLSVVDTVVDSALTQPQAKNDQIGFAFIGTGTGRQIDDGWMLATLPNLPNRAVHVLQCQCKQHIIKLQQYRPQIACLDSKEMVCIVHPKQHKEQHPKQQKPLRSTNAQTVAPSSTMRSKNRCISNTVVIFLRPSTSGLTADSKDSKGNMTTAVGPGTYVRMFFEIASSIWVGPFFLHLVEVQSPQKSSTTCADFSADAMCADFLALLNITKAIPYTLTIFPEGTRLTESKLRDSQEYCKSKGLQIQSAPQVSVKLGFIQVWTYAVSPFPLTHHMFIIPIPWPQRQDARTSILITIFIRIVSSQVTGHTRYDFFSLYFLTNGVAT